MPMVGDDIFYVSIYRSSTTIMHERSHTLAIYSAPSHIHGIASEASCRLHTERERKCFDGNTSETDDRVENFVARPQHQNHWLSD